MTSITPQRAESISQVVAPPRFDNVQLHFELPQDASPGEKRLYERLPLMVVGSRAGGGAYPTLDMCMGKGDFERVLEELRKHPRLTKSVVFEEGQEWPGQVVSAYLLQGAEQIKSDLF